MYTIKKKVISKEFECGERVSIIHADCVTVIYHCDPHFKEVSGDIDNNSISAIIVYDGNFMDVTDGEVVYIVNCSGKTIQTVTG